MTTNKIRVRIDWIVDERNQGDIEIVMDLDDFESSGTSIRKNITEFKKRYLSTIKVAKKADLANSHKRSVSTKNRWKTCRVLSDFNESMTNKFEITNYKEAYSRDFGLPMRSIRTYLDFGKHFSEKDILDEIPYSIYAELVFRINGLKSNGVFDAEKKRLIEMSENGCLPRRDQYRAHLKSL